MSSRSRSPRRWLVPVLAAAGGVALLLTVGFVLLRILGSSGWVSGAPGLPTPGSGSERVSVKPLPGVRITAPPGALDRTREVRFEDLGANGLKRLRGEAGGTGGVLPLRAFELDTGMAPSDRYPGNMTLSFDLKKLGIPKALWPGVRVVQIEDDGTRFPLVRRGEGRRLQVDVDRNSLVGLVVIGALAALIPVDMAWKDSTKLPGGPFIPFALPGCPGFMIHLGARRLPLKNQREVESVLDKMNGFRRPLGLPVFRLKLDRPPWIAPDGSTLDTEKLPTVTQWLEAEVSLRDDAAYTALEQLWRDPKWLAANVIPDKVLNVAAALNHARSYLKDVRKFRYPTYVIDVFLPDRNMSGFGYQDDLWFGHPFMIINREKIPAVRPGASEWNSVAQSCWNGFNLTVVHELFHVVQTRYHWTPSVFGTDTWFFEATAVALEAEAGPYYLGKKDWNITAWHGTVRDYSGFRGPLAFAWQTTHEHQQHGYSISHFLEYLRDTYYSGKKKSFLPRLMEDYSSTLGGSLNSLWRVTTGDAGTFGKAYRQFCRSHDEDMFLVPKSVKRMPILTPKAPVYSWKHRKFLELRCSVLEARVQLPAATPGAAKRKPEELVTVVARDEAAGLLEMPGLYELRWWDVLEDHWRPFGGLAHRSIRSDWPDRLRGRLITQTIRFVDCEEVVSRKVEKGSRLEKHLRGTGLPVRFERIEYQVFTGVDSWNRSSGKGVDLFAMYRPTAVPRITVDRKARALEFRVSPSVLAKKKLIEGYLLDLKLFKTTAPLGGTRPSVRTQVGPALSVFLGRDEHTVDITPLLEILGSGSAHNPFLKTGFSIRGLRITPREFRDWLDISTALGSDLEDLEVSYREVAGLKTRAWGPASEAVRVELPPPEADSFDPSGHWEGTTWLVRVPVTMDFSEAGGKVRGEISVKGKAFSFEGAWNAAEKAWVLEVPFGEVYLRRVAHHGLWLPAPPTVLRNPAWEAAEKQRREEAASRRGGLLEWLGWRKRPPAPAEALP